MRHGRNSAKDLAARGRSGDPPVAARSRASYELPVGLPRAVRP